MIPIARPRPILQGSIRVIRGGSWFYYSQFCQAAYRSGDEPSDRYYLLGFRVILRKRVK